LAPLVLLVAAGALAGFLLWRPRALDDGSRAARLPPGGDFTVQSAHGPVALHDLRGNVVLLYFGYAGCPDVCPTALARLGQGLALLTPAELARVRALFISVDPDRDAPPRLEEYGRFFHPAILGATVSTPVVDDIVARYGAAYRKHVLESAVGYVIDHTSFISVVDTSGALVERVADGNAPEDIAAVVRRWLPR
jgi:protein SCO1/2